MKNINIRHKIIGRIGDFHDLNLQLPKFSQWFMTLTQDQRIAYKITDNIVGFLDSFF